MPQTELLTAQEAAERLNVHAETIRRWHRAGLLDAIVFPSGRLRFHLQDVEQLLERQGRS